MVIQIRMTKRRFYDEDGNELTGYCLMRTPRRMSIQLSKRHNKTVNKYAGTMLHELIHAWVNMLELKGFQVEDDHEEKFVETVERIVIRRFKKSFGRK